MAPEAAGAAAHRHERRGGEIVLGRDGRDELGDRLARGDEHTAGDLLRCAAQQATRAGDCERGHRGLAAAVGVVARLGDLQEVGGARVRQRQP